MNATYQLINTTTHTIYAADEAEFMMKVNELSAQGVRILPMHTANDGKRTWATVNNLHIVGILTEL